MITRRVSKSGGGDHTSIASFNSYMSGLGTWADDYTAEIWHNGTSADELTDGPINFTGTPSTFRFYVNPKAGEGWADRSDSATDAYYYDNTRGACITGNTVIWSTAGAPLTLSGMQLKHTGTSSHCIGSDPDNAVIEGNIFENANDVGGSGYVVDVSSTNLVFRRNLLIARGCNVMLRLRSNANQSIHGNGLVALSGTNNYGIFGDGGNSGSTIYNTWIVGCATDAASLGSMTGSHNATDKASSGLPATSLQTSMTLSSEVESATNDFRVKSASTKLKDVGTAQGRATDAYGNSDNGTRDIGPFEYQSATAPEIAVTGNGNNITDGDGTPSATDHTDFGTTPEGTTKSRTFTITNDGDANLTISSVALSGAGAGEFTITTDPTGTIAPAGTGTLTVRADAANQGTFTATVTINSNDANEAAFDFAITGEVTAPAAESDTGGGGLLFGTLGSVSMSPRRRRLRSKGKGYF